MEYSLTLSLRYCNLFTAGLWSSALIADILSYILNAVPSGSVTANNAITLSISRSISRLLGNVPFVALYDLVMIDNGFVGDDLYECMMLAPASTVAGNLTILGAASNIIVMGAVESRGFKTFWYVDFLKIGLW